MSIKEAIAEAKQIGNWCIAAFEPSSVNVGFIRLTDGKEDQTQFDTWGDNHERELESIWKELHDEFDAGINTVSYVEALGYIQD